MGRKRQTENKKKWEVKKEWKRMKGKDLIGNRVEEREQDNVCEIKVWRKRQTKNKEKMRSKKEEWKRRKGNDFIENRVEETNPEWCRCEEKDNVKKKTKGK